MSKWAKLAKFLEGLKILEGVSYAVVFLGVPTFIVQQYLAVQEVRRERSLAIIERFAESDLLVARAVFKILGMKFRFPCLLNRAWIAKLLTRWSLIL